MAEERNTCSIILLSQDMEWMHAFQKGVERFYLFDVEKVETLDAMEEMLKHRKPAIIVLSDHEDMPTMNSVKETLHRIKRNIPVMVIANTITPEGGADAFVKQGAEFVVARRDLLSAIRAVQHVMRQLENVMQMEKTNHEMQALENRYDRLFLDLLDPVCYLQDGLFLKVNPAFLRTFKIKDTKALEELTMMNFVPLKSERALKQLMKLALEKEVVPSEKLELINTEEEKLDMTVSVNKIIYQDEEAIQVYFRDAVNSGGGGGGVDPSTGLPSGGVLKSSIRQTQERSEEKLLGTWIYFWLENYREVLQKDGYKTAEILMQTVAEVTQKMLPPSTEMARFSDDALLLWLGGDKEQTIERVQKLVLHLDEVIPEDIGRLIHPHVFAGMQEVRDDSTYEDLVCKSYRAVKSLAMGQSKERIAEPASANMSRKDERRINLLNKLIAQNLFAVQYQPISALEPDGVPRYSEKLVLNIDVKNKVFAGEDLELDTLLQIADRYGLARKLDRLKLTRFTEDLLSFTGDQKTLLAFVNLSGDALNDEEFPTWATNQLQQTGVLPQQIIFEISLDTANASFTGMMRLIEKMRPLGTHFALSDIARFDDEVQEIFAKVKPEIIKLDMREIDSFEDDEEQRFMTNIKAYADENKVMLIAAHMESPAQLSRVWPYDIQYLQGDGMVPPMDNFGFDFTEALF